MPDDILIGGSLTGLRPIRFGVVRFRTPEWPPCHGGKDVVPNPDFTEACTSRYVGESAEDALIYKRVFFDSIFDEKITFA